MARDLVGIGLILLAFFAYAVPSASAAITIIETEKRGINAVGSVVTTAVPFENRRTGIFTMTFSLEAFGKGGTIPTGVARSPETDTITYEILDGDKQVTSEGYAAGLLFSRNVPKEDDRYTLGVGEREIFTLIVAYTATTPDDYLVRINSIPLVLNDGTVVTFNPSELQDLETEFAELYW